MKRTYSYNIVFMTMFLFACFSSVHGETLRMHSRRSGMIINSPLYLNTDIVGFRGRLSVDHPSTDVIGSGKIVFDHGILESGTITALMSGEYEARDFNRDEMWLKGTSVINPHRFRAQPGTMLQKLYVANTQNWLEGQPLFDAPITFTGALDGSGDGAILRIAMQNKLNQNININKGTLVLYDDLALADGIVLDVDSNGTPTTGIIDINNRTLDMGGEDTTWIGTLYLVNATDIELHARTILSGKWTFSRSGACDSTYQEAYVNGNGNILDLTSGGTVYVEAGVRLHLVDLQVNGLGNASGQGKIVLQEATGSCPAAQLRLYNSEILLSDDYDVISGSWYVDGADSTILTYDHYLTFTGEVGNDYYGILTVDGVTLWWDNVDQPLKRTISPELPDAKHLVYVNHGFIATVQAKFLSGLHFDAHTQNYGSFEKSYDISEINPIVITDSGNNAATKDTMVIDGQGYYLYFQDGASSLFQLEPNVTVTLKNITLKNFSEAAIGYGNADSQIYFGDNVIIELASDQLIDEHPLKFASLGGTNGAKVIGYGKTLDLNLFQAVQVEANMTVTLQDIVISGLGLNGYELRNTDSSGQIDLIDAKLILEDHMTFSDGHLNIFDDVELQTCIKGKTFAYTSPEELTIHGCGKLLVDHGVTFSYDSAEPANDNLIINNGGRLYFNNSTLHATETGLLLKGQGPNSRVVIDDVVTFSSEGIDNGTAIIIDKDLPFEILSDAALDVYGPLVYEDQ